MKILKFLAVYVVALSFISTSYSQTNEVNKLDATNYDTWSVSLHLGTMQFYGDIANITFYPGSRKSDELSLTGHLALHKQFTKYFGINAQLLFGSLNSEQASENHYFNAQLFNYNLNSHISMSNLFFPHKENKIMDAYFIVGLGYTHYRTIRKAIDTDAYINSYGYDSEGKKSGKMMFETAATIGTGVKFKLNDRIDLGLEAVVRSTPKDKMDGVVNVLTELDKYGYTTIGITYKFGQNNNSLLWNKKDDAVIVNDKVSDSNRKMDSLANIINNMFNNVTVLMADRALEKGPDLDNDRVPDYRDAELNTPAGSYVDARGVAIPNCCSPDKPNYKPAPCCADAAGGDGLQAVFFGLNSYYITPLNHERIAIAALQLKRNPNMKYELIGSTCTLASNAYNIDLSKRRVETVKNILVKEYGIDPARLIIKYVGEEKPLNSTDHNKAYNRRVDIFVQK